MKGLKFDDIRAKTGQIQTEFAKSVGISARTYRDRLRGNYPNWKISEIVKIAMFNDGDLRIDVDGETYDIRIEKVDWQY